MEVGGLPIDHDLKSLHQDAGRLSRKLQAMLADVRRSESLDTYSGDVDAAYTRLKNASGQALDTKMRRFRVGGERGVEALLIYIDGLVDINQVNEDVLGPLIYCNPELVCGQGGNLHRVVTSSVLRAAAVSTETSWSKILPKINGGNTVVLMQGDPQAIVVDTTKFPQRAVDVPSTEQTVRGSQEGFTDVLLVNLNLVRRRLRTPRLRMASQQLGRLTKTTVVVLSIAGLTNPLLLRTVKHRLAAFQRDSVRSEQELLHQFSDRPLSLFPQARLTERVDEVVNSLVAGKVAVLMDGTTSAITLPATIMDFYQTSMDYNTSFWESTLVRVIRLIAWFLSLYLPAVYVALTSVNPDLIPAKLVLTLAGSHEGVPFPPVIEVFLMFVIIEILREAAIRLPKALAQTLGTVGAIVLGTAMAKAGIISNTMVIVVTVTALANFTTPVIEMATPWRILLWVMVAAAYVFGLYGIVLASIYLAWTLSGSLSLGVPYLSPFAPIRTPDLKDAIIRWPYPALTLRRPQVTSPLQIRAGRRSRPFRPVRLKAYQNMYRRDEP